MTPSRSTSPLKKMRKSASRSRWPMQLCQSARLTGAISGGKGSGALDELTRRKLNFELLRILRETSATLLLVTHSIDEAVILSDQVLVMSPRPGRMTKKVVIDFPHERSADVQDDPRFTAYAAELRHALHGDPAEAPAPRLKMSA